MERFLEAITVTFPLLLTFFHTYIDSDLHNIIGIITIQIRQFIMSKKICANIQIPSTFEIHLYGKQRGGIQLIIVKE